MPSKLLYRDPPMIPPAVCTVCGENAPCIDRQTQGDCEVRMFLCACGNIETRLGNGEPSDAAIQGELEQRIQAGKI